MNSSTCRWRVVSGPPAGPAGSADDRVAVPREADRAGAGRAAMEWTVTRSRVRGKHPFVFSLTSNVCSSKVSVSPGCFDVGRRVRERSPGSKRGSQMVAALQAPPRARSATGRAPARVVPLRLVPDQIRPDPIRSDRLRPDRVVVVHRQPRPRVTRRERAAVYWRRRAIATALGLGIVLTAAHAGVALGGSTTSTSGRSPHPHVERVVVRQGDTLWSIAKRLAPSSDPRAVVDALAGALGTSDLQPGRTFTWPVS